jgi:hypothetical protein
MDRVGRLPGECGVGCYFVGFVSVDPRFFDVVGAPVIRGRALTTADAELGTRVVLVNELFVDQVLGGRNPLAAGFASSSANPPPSRDEIVGVVPIQRSDEVGSDARIYQTTLPREMGPLESPFTFAAIRSVLRRLRELAQATDPALRVIDPKPLPLLVDPDSAECRTGSSSWSA